MKSILTWFFKNYHYYQLFKNNIKNSRKKTLRKVSKVISNSSFTLSKFLCEARNLEKKTNHLFLETKMTKYVLQFYIYTATFYGFHMLSKFVQSQCLRSDTFTQWLLLELWQRIKCLMLGQNIYQQQMDSWKFSKGHVGEDIQSSNHLQVNSPQSLCQPTKMYHKYRWHMKNTWWFL